jgi:Ser/Thr protein kinase RdoA (MazF antagonist)
VIHHLVVVIGLRTLMPISARSGKADRNLPDHCASAVIALTGGTAEARADHLGQTCEDLGQVAARLLLDPTATARKRKSCMSSRSAMA